MQRQRAVPVAAVAFVMLALAAIMLMASSSPNTPQPSRPAVKAVRQRVDTVRVLRTSDVPQPNLAPFDRVGHDAAKVQALYDGLLSLPAYSAGGRACPTDVGVQYQVTFSRGSTIVLTAFADPSGCQIVLLSANDDRTAARSGVWTQLATAVGVPSSAVYPLP